MNLREQATSAVFWTAIRSWGSQAMSFMVFVALARLLAPEDFGLVAYATVFLGLLQVFVEGGFSKAIVQREQLEPEHLDTAFWTNIGIAGLLLAGVQAGAEPIAELMGDARVAPLLRWLSLILLLNALSDMQIAVLRRRLQMKPLAQRMLVAQAVGGAIGLGMAFSGYGVWALVGQTLSAAVFTAIILWVMSDWRPGLRVSRRHFRDIFSFGFSVVGTSLLLFISSRADRLLIGSLLGPAALGIYVVGFRAVRIVIELVTKILAQVALPVFSRMQDDLPRMRRSYFSVLRSNCLLTFPAYMLLAALAPDVVPALFGDQWDAAVPVMQVLALLGLSQSMQLFAGPITTAMGKPQWLLIISGSSAVVGIGGIALAAPYGIVSVAVVVALRGWLLLPMFLECLRRLIGIRFGELLRLCTVPLLASLAIGLLAHFVAQALTPQLIPWLRILIAGATGTLVYALLIRIFAPALFSELQDRILSLVPQRLRDRFASQP